MGRPRKIDQPHRGAGIRYITGFFARRDGILARNITYTGSPEVWAVRVDGEGLIASLPSHFIIVRAARSEAA